MKVKNRVAFNADIFMDVITDHSDMPWEELETIARQQLRQLLSVDGGKSLSHAVLSPAARKRYNICVYVRVDELPERLENFTREEEFPFDEESEGVNPELCREISQKQQQEERGRTNGVPGWKEEEYDASA